MSICATIENPISLKRILVISTFNNINDLMSGRKSMIFKIFEAVEFAKFVNFFLFFFYRLNTDFNMFLYHVSSILLFTFFYISLSSF